MKITKLSLATIIALGSISLVNAQSLEDAIKNVEISGTAAYRYNDYETKIGSNNYKVATNLRSSVNDDLTFNSRVIIGDGSTNPDSIATNTTDRNLDIGLSEVNFAYSGIQNTVVTAGKQALATPFTISRDAMGNEQTGTGIVATTNLDMVSLTGGFFNQTNLSSTDGEAPLSETVTGAEDVYFVAADLAIENVTLDAAYINLLDTLDAYTVGIKGKFDVAGVALNPYARYSALDFDNNSANNTLWKVGTDAQMGIFGAYVAYGETNEEGGETGLDYSSDTGMDDHWRVTLTGISDASVVYASVNTQVTDSVNFAIKYSDLNAGSMSNDKDQNEIFAQATYKMSKNFTTFARLGQYEYNGDTSNMGRLHMQYSF